MPDPSFLLDGVRLAATKADPGLHIVATPIGNLGDISVRALKTLAGADHIAVEDTRHTGRLLTHFGIETPMMRYDEHSAAAQRPRILAVLADGGSVALVSDAGTPLISDPGYKLVSEARAAGARVHAVPGASAVVAALSVAGLPTDAFMFAGFLPPKTAARRNRIEALATVPATLAFYEAPHRLGAALADLSEVLGPRDAIVARELTKRFETVDNGTLADLAARYGETDVKGEIVILVGPPGEVVVDEAEAETLLGEALTRLPASAAAAEVAKVTGRNRRELYRLAMALKGGAQ
ncbi:16S rRNA (cytidine(1402)-2'-O)-methyltransferase [Acuticoccus sp. MNP-M23]|uniref:16S rRNA (cytidine(1402)-2'-O)-methyltransferase n=1 Tax=Acuticoccus sp. MNP-M23 TaxID=3072793 RepID=UPI002814BE6D|nr:16S rRNA (cytidine(1402)-2'-O)-methyltransferase [Acuticoccus sp. MNP-M23]WMS44818.1 16S rRNA (cytidine(1402)-2'-O)-methyltransferase [Acuticoccus sp. MNP-M23]